MDYKKLHEETLAALQKMVFDGKITEETARSICSDFIKESEDERIRKAILELVRQSSEILDKQNQNNMIAWIEKQGERKPTDKIEPKFKAGDIIINEYGFIMQIDGIDSNMYMYHVLGDNRILKHDITKTDESCHLWTIQDARDGDVLAVENIIFVYKSVLASQIVSYCKLYNNKFEPFCDVRTCSDGNSNVHPATKEQCDLLFQKMKEAGYEWLSEDRKLIKIAQ